MLYFRYILILFFSCNVFSHPLISKENLQTHVNYLCSKPLEGRLTGTHGEQLATKYVADQFRRFTLEPAGQNGSFFQTFQFSSKLLNNQGNSIVQGRNVIAKLSIDSNPKSIIVIGAHIDHLGHGVFQSSRQRNNETGLIHPGADDNASGVASLIEVAATLSQLKKTGQLHGNYDILFTIWSGEELGVLGSTHFVSNYFDQTQHTSIAAMINLDMVGHLRKHLVIQGVGSSNNWEKLITDVKTKLSLSVLTQKDPYLPTDSTPFYLHNVPTLNFFTGAHENYHTPRDTPDTLNYEGMQQVSEFLVHLILALENHPQTMKFASIPKPPDNTKNGLKVYLGTIPNYASSDRPGVKISGVAKNSPAEKAGLQPNDKIIELAGQKINDLYAYTHVINHLPIGQPIRLVVIRGQNKLSLTIVAAKRIVG